MATSLVLLINSIASCLASVSLSDVKMTVRGYFLSTRPDICVFRRLALREVVRCLEFSGAY